MAGEAQGGTLVGVWRTRLTARLNLLAVVAVVLIALVVVAQLQPAIAVIALLVIAIAAALLPEGESEGAALAGPTGVQPISDSALQLFADALPDPCVVLDSALGAHPPKSAGGAAIPKSCARQPDLYLAARSRRAERRRGRTPRRDAEIVELHQTVPTETWHRVTVAPLVAGDGGGMLIVTLQSLTDEKRLEPLRTDFIANASHELRTPLTSLLGFIDTLLGPAAKDAAAQGKFLGIMRTQAVRMSKLIEDLLSLSRIEMRQHVRPTEQVDLALLLREVAEGLQTQADEAGVAVKLDVPDRTGDRHRRP